MGSIVLLLLILVVVWAMDRDRRQALAKADYWQKRYVRARQAANQAIRNYEESLKEAT